MFGKFFASTFTGSMVGAGPDVFAVWGYVIANCVDSQIEINPRYLAPILGCDIELVKAAVEYLCKPDEESRNKDNNGARLVYQTGFTYIVPSHRIYRNILNEDDRRDYFRKKKQEQRARQTMSNEVSKTVKDSQRMSNMSTHTEAETEAEAETDTPPTPSLALVVCDDKPKNEEFDKFWANSRWGNSQATARPMAFDGSSSPNKIPPSDEFVQFWEAYPKKVSKPQAEKAFKRQSGQAHIVAILASLELFRKSEDWTRDGGQFIPYPASWLNARRWEDKPITLATTHHSSESDNLPLIS